MDVKTEISKQYDAAVEARIMYEQLAMTNIVKWAMEKLTKLNTYKVKGNAETKAKVISLLYMVYAEAIEAYAPESALKYVIDYNETLENKVDYITIFNTVKQVNKKIGRAYGSEEYSKELQGIVAKAIDEQAEETVKTEEQPIVGDASVANSAVEARCILLMQENSELKQENSELKQENSDLKKVLAAKEEKIAVEYAKRVENLLENVAYMTKKITVLEKWVEDKDRLIEELRSVIEAKTEEEKHIVAESRGTEDVVSVVSEDKPVGPFKHIWERYGLKKTTYYKRKAEGTLPPSIDGVVNDEEVENKGMDAQLKDVVENTKIVVEENPEVKKPKHIWERYGLKKTTYYKRKAEGTLPEMLY